MKHSALFIVSMVFLLTSCFKTRDIEDPVQTLSDWVSPTDYSILLKNFEKSVNEGNTQNYLRCFRQDEFRFIPSTVVYTGNQLVWDNWSWQDEQAWFNNVHAHLGLTSGNYLNLTQTDIQSFSSDSLRYIGNYEMVMNHTDTLLTVKFTGQLEFMIKVNTYNEWEITNWQDFETKTDSAWSRLKLKYVQ